jgi:hypothetical protein
MIHMICHSFILSLLLRDADYRGFILSPICNNIKKSYSTMNCPYRDNILKLISMILQTVFKVDFVVMDANSQAVDNNRGQDYHLRLVDALSEDQILERQSLVLAQMEEKRLQARPPSPSPSPSSCKHHLPSQELFYTPPPPPLVLTQSPSI